ncbi:MAG TPA: hypothetical protein V6C65_39935 [Allocoleopsis sp.]
MLLSNLNRRRDAAWQVSLRWGGAVFGLVVDQIAPSYQSESDSTLTHRYSWIGAIAEFIGSSVISAVQQNEPSDRQEHSLTASPLFAEEYPYER